MHAAPREDLLQVALATLTAVSKSQPKKFDSLEAKRQRRKEPDWHVSIDYFIVIKNGGIFYVPFFSWSSTKEQLW